MAENNRVLALLGIEESTMSIVIKESFGLTNIRQEAILLVVKLTEIVNKLPAVIRQAVM